MMKSILLFLFFVYSVNSFSQLKTDSILVGTYYRTFHYNEPTNSISNKSLIFALHGSGGNGINLMQHSNHLETEITKKELITVYPNGYHRYWNECRKASTADANQIDIDENEFFNQMIHFFYNKYQIDTTKIFAIGFSGGGHMAYKLAMTMPDKFKGICAIVANLPTPENLDCAGWNKPIAVMIVNGTADEVNPYNGGEVKIAAVKLGNVRSTNETFQYWATINGYTKKPKINTISSDIKDAKKVIQYTYSKKKKYDVRLYKVIDGKHEFPNAFDAFGTAWEFFKLQTKKKI